VPGGGKENIMNKAISKLMNVKGNARRLLATVAVAVPLGTAALALAPTAHADGANPAHLYLYEDQSNWHWVVNGSYFQVGLNNISLWIMDLGPSGADWNVFDYRSGISGNWYPGAPGGVFSVSGDMNPPLPLSCGHQYEAVAVDSSDGWVYGNVFAAPACIY
jgi:hypothetical protein